MLTLENDGVNRFDDRSTDRVQRFSNLKMTNSSDIATRNGSAQSVPRSVGTLKQRREPLHWPGDREFRILSIDGGGIKGVYAAAVLAELEQRYLGGESIAGYFDLVVGTSTGGIIALGLGSERTAQDLRDLYVHRGREIFPSVGKIARVASFSKRIFKHGYSSDVLKSVLHEYLGDLTLSQSTARLCVPAADGFHSDVHVYKTPHHPDLTIDAAARLVDIGLATSAAPTYLRPLEHKGYTLIDGGLWSNNPIVVGLVEALSSFDVKRGNIRILSIGCGNSPFKVSHSMIQFGGMLAWYRAIEAALYFQSVGALNQARLLIGFDRVTRIEPLESNLTIELDDWQRAIDALIPAAKEAVAQLGDGLASGYLDREAESYFPLINNSTHVVDDSIHHKTQALR